MGARGPTDFGDYQIAHLPPPSASVGAARWAAKYTLLRSVFCRMACQHAADKPAHCRAVRGSGSGSYRRVPEPVIARHPRGRWKRQRGETYTRFDAEPFYTAVVIGQGKSKNHWFLAAFFPPLLPLLEEMGPPEAQSREGGAEPRPYADVQNFIVSAAQRAAPTLAASGGKCAI